LYDGAPPYQCEQCPINIRPGRGCETKTKTPVQLDPIIEDGRQGFKYVFDTCPVHYVRPESRNWLILFSLFKKNLLLEPGGIGEQPAKYIDVMLFIDAIWNAFERDSMEKARSK